MVALVPGAHTGACKEQEVEQMREQNDSKIAIRSRKKMRKNTAECAAIQRGK
jgi:hypothetical protein